MDLWQLHSILVLFPSFIDFTPGLGPGGSRGFLTHGSGHAGQEVYPR